MFFHVTLLWYVDLVEEYEEIWSHKPQVCDLNSKNSWMLYGIPGDP